MTPAKIQEMQRKIRLFYLPADQDGCDDGFWGPKSIAALQRYLRHLMPAKSPWPKSDPKSMVAFYGQPGDEQNLVSFSFPYATFYGGKRVLTGRCHHKVRDSLLRVLNRIGELHGNNPDVMDEAADYGGIFNFRNKRGGATLSIHAWGAAIDLDADDNTFRDSWPVKADMNLAVIEEFSREGWVSAAAWWGYDAMHFQATQI